MHKLSAKKAKRVSQGRARTVCAKPPEKKTLLQFVGPATVAVEKERERPSQNASSSAQVTGGSQQSVVLIETCSRNLVK